VFLPSLLSSFGGVFGYNALGQGQGQGKELLLFLCNSPEVLPVLFRVFTPLCLFASFESFWLLFDLLVGSIITGYWFRVENWIESATGYLFGYRTCNIFMKLGEKMSSLVVDFLTFLF